MDTLNLLLLFLTAVVNCLTALMVIVLRRTVVDAAKNILKVEQATNSMKDALVAATAKASRGEGLAEGLAQAAAAKKK